MNKIAHRGNVNGINKEKENTLAYLKNAVNNGYGIETDLRCASDCDKLIISHDPAPYSIHNDANHILNNIGNTFIALNIKESGLVVRLHEILPKLNGFVFDFELWCDQPENEIEQYLNFNYKIARRYSEKERIITGYYDYIWLDEMFETNILDTSNIDLTQTIYVSPELHGRDREQARTDDFFAICTDYCL